jgi:hypothetical protein
LHGQQLLYEFIVLGSQREENKYGGESTCWRHVAMFCQDICYDVNASIFPFPLESGKTGAQLNPPKGMTGGRGECPEGTGIRVALPG